MEQKTPLYHVHLQAGGKMVPFAGYLLPVQYQTGVIKEHLAVRTQCGLFDVSHMGEITCTGTDALANLNQILTNDFTNMEDGQARYSVMCYPTGGVVDDLIVYKIRENQYFIVVNASNKDKDFAWMKEQESGDAVFTDISHRVGQIALQGPKAYEILSRLVAETMIPTAYYTANFNGRIDDIDCIISKTGYTGEDGYELYMGAEKAPTLWGLLMDAGQPWGLIPCGLGARDTLRLEAGMPLYGHEMSEEITPLEAGVSFAVKLKKEEFVGKEALEESKPVARKRVGLKVTGRGIIREGEAVYVGEQKIGETTSGTHAPFLGYPIAMALVDCSFTEPGTQVEAEVRGRKIAAEIVPLPFYKKGQSNKEEQQ